MDAYIYKCISLILEPDSDSFITDTARSYESVLNEAAKDGWQLDKIDTISPLSSDNHYNTNTFTETAFAKVLIFKKQKTTSDKSIQPELRLNEIILSCPNCKTTVSEEDIYCENCAYKLK